MLLLSGQEIVLLVGFICLLVVGGYLVAMQKQIKPTSQASATTVSVSQMQLSDDQVNIASRVKYILDYDNDNHDPNAGQTLYGQGYITKNFLDEITSEQNNPYGVGADPFTCAQATPLSWSYDPAHVSADGQAATSAVSGDFDSGFLTPSKPYVVTTNWVKVSGTWQEDSITCPSQ